MTAHHTTRRAILAGAAAAPIAAIPGTASASSVLPAIDPIFAAIESHRRAFAEYGRVLRETPEDRNVLAEAAVAKACDGADDAARALLDVPPSTTAGAAALLRYVAEFEEKYFDCMPDRVFSEEDGEESDGIDWHHALQRHVADALDAMRPLGGGSVS